MAPGVRVLVVEDDESDRNALELALAEAGFEVVPAVNGLRALRTGSGVRPDLVLVDIGPPTIDARSRRALWSERDLDAEQPPVIAMSALPYGERMAVAMGAVDFVRKPFRIEDVVSAVRRHTRR